MLMCFGLSVQFNFEIQYEQLKQIKPTLCCITLGVVCHATSWSGQVAKPVETTGRYYYLFIIEHCVLRETD